MKTSRIHAHRPLSKEQRDKILKRQNAEDAEIVVGNGALQRSDVGCSAWLWELEAVLAKLYSLTASAAETGRNDILDDLLAARINIQETVNTERSRSPNGAICSADEANE